MIRKAFKRTSVLAGLVVALQLAVPAAEAQQKLTPATLQLSWTIQGRDAPFILALQRGYYRDVGIELTVNEGQGSTGAAQAVAAGNADFASADVATGAVLRGMGAGLKSIMVFQPKGGLGIAYHPGTKIEKFADLKGVTVIRAASDNSSQMFSALLAMHNMSWDDVKPVIVGQGAFESSFLADKKSVLLGNYFSTFQAIRLKHPDVRTALYSDLGLQLMTLGVLANEKTLAERPEFVRNFLAASVKGFQEAIKNPEAAVKAVAEKFPLVARAEINRLQLEASLALLWTPENKSKRLGWTSEKEWADMIDLLKKYSGLKGDLPVGAYYTNDFLPK